MRLLLWFTLLVVTFIAIQSIVDGGLIRRSRRLRRIGPFRRSGVRSPRVLNKRKWPHFLAPPRKLTWGRNNRRMRNEKEERHPIRPGHHLRLPLMMAQPTLVKSSATQLNSWRPLDFGNPIDRDPTFDYAPPTIERVQIAGRPDKRRRNNKPPGLMRSQEGGKPRPHMYNRPRRPSIWKLLATKQRPRRPMGPRRPPPYHRFPDAHNSNDEAEIFPRFPNYYVFKPSDVLPSVPSHVSSSIAPARPGTHVTRPMHLLPAKPTFKPGTVTNVPLYSNEHQSLSQFNPVPVSTTPVPTFIPSKPDDLLYRAQEFINPTRKPPTILQPAKSTPITVSATRTSVIKPVKPTLPTDTEALLAIINDPPKPLNSFSIFNPIHSLFGNQDKTHKPQVNNDKVTIGVVTEIVKAKPTPVTTDKPTPVFQEEVLVGENTAEESSTVSFSTSVSTSTSVLIRTPQPPKFTTTTTPTTTTTTTTTATETPTSSTTPPLSYQKLPEMPTYKRRQPIYPKRHQVTQKVSPGKSSPIIFSKGTSNNTPSSKESNGSGEGLIITVGRSKVKEYKPQMLANYTQLLTFDKVVADGDVIDNDSGEPVTLPSLHSSAPTNPTVISSVVSQKNETVTEKSILQEFDPMQLLHSWFQNT